MKLVIVESPTKAKTIKKFLGKDYQVESSYGHVRDLPKGDLGVDVAHNFEPTYVIPTKVRKRVNELKKLAPKAEETILATDEDREGESISWHLSEALGLSNAKRIAFHEITKDAIRHGIAGGEILRKEGLAVTGLAAVFTYGFEESAQAFSKAGCPFVTLTDYETLILKALQMEYIGPDMLASLKEWRKRPDKWGT